MVSAWGLREVSYLDGELGGGKVGMAVSTEQVLWSFVLRQLSVSLGPHALLSPSHPELPGCPCNEVATGCCPRGD